MRAAVAADRNAGHRGLRDSLDGRVAAVGRRLVELIDTLGVNAARQHHVDGHSLCRHFGRKRLRPPYHRGPDPVGQRQARNWLFDAGGGNGDDPSPASLGHGRHQSLRQVKEVRSHSLEMDEPVLALGLAGFRRWRTTGVPDENVDPTCLKQPVT